MSEEKSEKAESVNIASKIDALLRRAYAKDSVERFPSATEEQNEWRTGTTFYGDFTVAEVFDAATSPADTNTKSLDDTWNRAWNEWKADLKYMVELCICMNHLCWENFSIGNSEKSSSATKEKAMIFSKWYSDKYYFLMSHIFGTDEKTGKQRWSREELDMAFNIID